MLDRALSSPKRAGARRDSDLYYYYAAFSQSFVEKKILELNLPQGSLILDPWCGSGTTLAAARRYGHNSLGCDINPVSVILTKSRFASTEDVDAVGQVLAQAIASLKAMSPSERTPDVLLWALRQKLMGNQSLSLSLNDYREMPPKVALLLTALFFFARQATRVTRSKNPSWRKQQTSARLSFRELQIYSQNLIGALDDFKRVISEKSSNKTAHQVSLLNNEFDVIAPAPVADAVITSPPYLTRLDYGVATGLEWRLLKGDPVADLTDWRASFTGSVLTSHVVTSTYPLPRLVGDVLAAIQRHQSKAARTYYFQFFRNYFAGIQNAIGNISEVCKIGAKGLFVVQDSQFKDVNIPLTRLFSEMLKDHGWLIEKVEPFSISPTFYRINTKRWAAEDFVRSENLIWAKRMG